jgi:hypothetical protein
MKVFHVVLLLALCLLPCYTIAQRHQPCARSLKACPNVGCGGGDRALNAQKNRKSRPRRVENLDSLDDLANRDVPEDWEAGRPRTELKGYGEGKAVRVAAYLIHARDQGPESCNCYLRTDANYDIHLVLVTKDVVRRKPTLEQREPLSQTAEMTPY